MFVYESSFFYTKVILLRTTEDAKHSSFMTRTAIKEVVSSEKAVQALASKDVFERLLFASSICGNIVGPQRVSYQHTAIHHQFFPFSHQWCVSLLFHILLRTTDRSGCSL